MLNELFAVQAFYGSRVAKRSQVPLINHIREGLIIMATIGASTDAMAAFCLHPLFQDDKTLLTDGEAYLARFSYSRSVMLVMEYRSTANAYLAHCVMPETGIRLSPLIEVNHMLIADKVQNRKDFIKYHAAHENAERLAAYFTEWLDALNVSEEEYQRLATLAEKLG